MSYYFSKTLPVGFDEAVRRATEVLKKEGFGIITEIDVKQTLKAKIGVDFRNYRILGACNPKLAHEALQLEDKIGTMLPCNVVVQEIGNNQTEAGKVTPKPVSPAQMLYAKRIAQGKGVIIPDEAKANSAAMSAWIDSNRGTKRRKRGRNRAAIMRMKFSVHPGT
jgi:uncharacterized protein (DUF302 family)